MLFQHMTKPVKTFYSL